MKDPYAEGLVYLRTVNDHFKIEGLNGASHICLVFDAMREPLSQFQERLRGTHGGVGLLLPLAKTYTTFMLRALDYLHSDCKIVHTGRLLFNPAHLCVGLIPCLDLKADNIMMTFEDPSVIEEYVTAQAEHPMPRKVVGDRNIYLSYNDFGPMKSLW